MNSYNNFSPAQRLRALAWMRRQEALGLRDPVVTECEVCTQREGKLMLHSEDYSEPFGPHIGAHKLCFRCHMMIHCRFRNPDAWQVYRTDVLFKTFAPCPSFPRFMQETINGRGLTVGYTRREPVVTSTFLDSLEMRNAP